MDTFETHTMDNDSIGLTEVQNFYNNSNIFITGATGFLGHVLVEKLLRSCPGVSTVYILVRNKKGKNVNTRLEEIFEDVVFDRLRKEFPKFRHKIVGVAGDCSLSDLGLSIADRKTLIENVNIVFHGAATVRFDETLKVAVNINIRGTQAMLSLAQQMVKLQAFIHVSTAYANCTTKFIEEKIYPPAINYKTLIVMAETVPEKILDKMTPMLQDKYPNTYALTKQIAEYIVFDMGKNLPVGITRPAIIVSSYKEPIPAWINNMYTVTGAVAGAGLGLIRSVNCDESLNSNIVPVDMCVNSMLTAAWDVSERFLEAQNNNEDLDIPIYNFESNSENPITWKSLLLLAKEYGLRIPSMKAIWYFVYISIKNKFLYDLYCLFMHTLPALFLDGVLLCVGKKPKMLKVYKKIHKFSGVISYFAIQSWTFQSDNVRRVCQKMSERDNQIFFSDIKKIDWNDYFTLYAQGIRTYLVKDPMDTVPEARIKWRRLYWIHQITKTVVGFLVLRLLWTLISWFYSYIY